MGWLLVIINLHIHQSVITCPFYADEGCKKAKPKCNPVGDAVTSHLAFFNRRATAFLLFKHSKEETRRRKKSRCRGCVRVRLFQTPRTTWGKRGQKFSRSRSLQNFTKFSANSSSPVSQLHPTCNKLIVQRADALTQQPHAFICRSTRTGTDFP